MSNHTSQPIEPYGDNFIPLIPLNDDYQEHTLERPFCTSDRCPCREDQDAIDELNSQYQDGLVSRNDVDRIYQGRTV